MKIRVYWLTLLASAAIITQTQAHGFSGGGASFGGAHFSGARTAIAHAPMATAYRAATARSSAPNRVTYANRYPNYNRGTFANQSARNHVAYSYSRRSVTNIGGVHNLPSNWRNHVYGRHSADWHRDWDHNSDHWWHGHRCHFFNGTWVVFDAGFDPGWWWPCPEYYDGYPCDDGY